MIDVNFFCFALVSSFDLLNASVIEMYIDSVYAVYVYCLFIMWATV